MCVGVCRVWSVEHVERFLRDLDPAAFDLCVNLIFPAVLFVNDCMFRFKSQKCLRKRKTGLYEVFLRLKTRIFDNFTKERALDLNLG